MTSDPADPHALDPAAPPEDGLARRQRRADQLAQDPLFDDESIWYVPEDEPTPAPEPQGRGGRRRAAKAGRKPKSSTRNALEWVGVIVGAVVIALVVRTFLFQTFWIPSPSMSDTLVEGDRVLVNKLSYRFGDPKRGDVVVFKRPPTMDPSQPKDLIKRVIGLPGERVSIRESKVFIDGAELTEPYTDGLPTTYGVCGNGVVSGIDSPEGLLIPEGHVFVMGDNRVNSQDGRCFGPIDEDLIVGRAFFLLWPPSRAGGL